MKGYYAHTPNANQRWHSLEEHLKNVADRAAAFGGKFGAEKVCFLLGLLHDVGKATHQFQQYLQDASQGKRLSPPPHSHSEVSARVGYKYLNTFTLAVLGHHKGIPSPADAKKHKARVGDDVSDFDAQTRQFLARLADLLHELSDQDYPKGDNLDQEFFLRMCFSALVDADYLDTESHFDPTRSEARATYPAIEEYAKKLDDYLNQLNQSAPDTPVNRVRREIQEHCRRSASQPQGAYRLTVPTGGGKTLAGLLFAINHALHHNLERIVFAIPYTSIIDQTAEIYKRIFGPDNVLEHHSLVEWGDEEETHGVSLRLASENWDSPLIVTTTVQLFESLFANKPSRCRKLHNIARSVIVIDEVQTLPVTLMTPITDALQTLIKSYGCSVFLCTATPPDFSTLPHCHILTEAKDLIGAPQEYYRSLKRVTYEVISEPMTTDQLTDLVASHKQILCVLNSRKDAVRITKQLLAQGVPDVYHLSSLMYPRHRKRVLAEVRDRLACEADVRLVSTQVVEAGVDLDFPVVVRDVGPLDRIIQVAGRANREGKRSCLGKCVIVTYKEGTSPSGSYKTGVDISKCMLLPRVAAQPDVIDSLSVVKEYFRELYRNCNTDASNIQVLRKEFNYPKVATSFRMIAEDTIGVVIEAALVNDHLRISGTSLFPTFRHLQQYMVGLPAWLLPKLLAQGHLKRTTQPMELFVYAGPYHDVYGINVDGVIDPLELIV